MIRFAKLLVALTLVVVGATDGLFAAQRGRTADQPSAPTRDTARSPDRAPQFDITDVRSITPSLLLPNAFARGGVLRGNRYELRNATMLDLIRTAYDVDADRVIGGPSWLELKRYDVDALAPTGTPPAVLQRMLQSLLADRFKLVIRNDTQPMAGYALKLAADTPTLAKTSGGVTECQTSTLRDSKGFFTTVVCRNVTMATFAERLPRLAGQSSLSPVVDMTGMKGSFDLELKWNPTAKIADIIARQLGLRLESLPQVPAPVLRVESVTMRPTDNPPDIALKMPPLLAFELAVIRKSRPGTSLDVQVQQNGQVRLSGASLRTMIDIAWRIPNPSDDFIAGPSWLSTRRFDVTTSADMRGNALVDPDLPAILRQLMVERFGIKFHTEDRLVNAYALIAKTPKMAKADPSRRSRCVSTASAAGSDRKNQLPFERLMTCQNVTMAEFAELLPSLAPAVRTSVADMTGITGRWDFAVRFSQSPGVQGTSGGSGTAVASDPTGIVSIFEAIDGQLGLKLERRRRMLPVMVIDSISETPTDN
jgi:uncharacterized protein (TIGR03435 family)